MSFVRIALPVAGAMYIHSHCALNASYPLCVLVLGLAVPVLLTTVRDRVGRVPTTAATAASGTNDLPDVRLLSVMATVKVLCQ